MGRSHIGHVESPLCCAARFLTKFGIETDSVILHRELNKFIYVILLVVIGAQIKALRTARKVSNRLLASCAGWFPSYVSTLDRSPRVSLRRASPYTPALRQASLRASA